MGFLHIGGEELLDVKSVVGVFDVDTCTPDRRSRSFLDRAAKEGETVDFSGELPASFVVCTHPYHRQIVYLSPLSTDALRRRHERGGGL